MDYFIGHHNPIKFKSIIYVSIFILWDLKKTSWIALFSTDNFEQVISHFADFEQVIIEIVVLLTFKKSQLK